MNGVHIITDSGSDLSIDQAAELGVSIVPLSIRFGEEEYSDRVELGVQEFYDKMAATDGLPATAAPAPGAFLEAFTAAADGGATGIVCINLAGDMSATIQSAQNAATSIGDAIPIRVVDSLSVSGGQSNLVRNAVLASRDGKSVDEIADEAVDRAKRTRILGAFDSLENLKAGGRIGGAQAFLGTLLSIKPIISIRDGKVHEAGKQRTRRKALQWIRDRVFEAGEVEDLTVCSGLAPDVETFVEMFAPRYQSDDLPIVTIGATIGTHGGQGILGVSYVLPPGTD